MTKRSTDISLTSRGGGGRSICVVRPAKTHQPLSEQTKTLATLAKAKFNKIRMGLFPKDYPYNAMQAELEA